MHVLPERYSKCAESIERDANPAGTLFHYTTWGGLNGILNTQQLWLTHFSQLTDTSEVHHGLKCVGDFIFNIMAPKDNMYLFWKSIFEDIQDLITNEYDFFVGSFSMKRNYLSAWRQYANDGSGFSIGFKKEFFLGVSSASESNAPPFGRCRVYYDFQYLEDALRYLVETTQEDLRNEDALRDTKESISSRLLIAKYFMASLLPFLSAIKHPAYEEEQEHRIYTSMPKLLSLQTLHSCEKDINESHLNPKKRVYFQFELEHISEIWVGPKLNFEQAKYDIGRVVNQLKKDGKISGEIKVIPSGIPYGN